MQFELTILVGFVCNFISYAFHGPIETREEKKKAGIGKHLLGRKGTERT
jgi:hypothetical protein